MQEEGTRDGGDKAGSSEDGETGDGRWKKRRRELAATLRSYVAQLSIKVTQGGEGGGGGEGKTEGREREKDRALRKEGMK